jgi:predicted DNA-binding transcriptional regulator YafY
VSQRIDTKLRKTERLTKLIQLLMNARAPIPLNKFEDDSEWGSLRTFLRLRSEINLIWEELFQSPLFEIVDSDGKPATRGERFLKLADKNLVVDELTREILPLTSLGALTSFLNVCKGTQIEDDFAGIKGKIIDQLNRKEREFLKRSEDKFFQVQKGHRNYSKQRDVIAQVHSALLKERVLEATYNSQTKGEEKIKLEPLAMVHFNGGLYLVARKCGQVKPLTWRLESFLSAICVRDGFVYPRDFSVKRLFKGQFGIIYGGESDRTEVELSFAADAKLHSYIQGRSWTGDESYSKDRDGRLNMKLTVTSFVELKSFILSIGSSVEVLRPKILRDDIKTISIAMANLYK